MKLAQYEASEYPKLVGKKFQVMLIKDDPEHLPFIARSDGSGIRNNAIYTRNGPESEEANYEDLQRIINRRLETGYSSRREMQLQEHMEQLKILFGFLSKYRTIGGLVEFTALSSGIFGSFGSQSVLNPKYPAEDFEAFVINAINRKKKRIEAELDIDGLKLRTQ